MAYYDDLIAKLATLTGTTAQKLAAINALTVTGTIPTTFVVTGAQIMNCLDFGEFNTLSAAQQSIVMQICAVPGTIVSGANTFTGKLFASYYSTKLTGPTITAFIALAQGVVQSWWQANGYSSPISANDLAAAGGLT